MESEIPVKCRPCRYWLNREDQLGRGVPAKVILCSKHSQPARAESLMSSMSPSSKVLDAGASFEQKDGLPKYFDGFGRY